ncbi:hypothetical protein ACO0QE_000977 [Hanseniaspora vineae]
MSVSYAKNRVSTKDTGEKHKTSTFNAYKKKNEYKGKKNIHFVTNNRYSEGTSGKSKNQMPSEAKDHCSKPKPKHNSNLTRPKETCKTKSISTQTEDRVSLQLFNMFKMKDIIGEKGKCDEQNDKESLDDDSHIRADIHKRKNSNFSDTSTSSNQTLFGDFACPFFEGQPKTLHDCDYIAGHDKSTPEGHSFPINYYLNKETSMSLQHKNGVTNSDVRAIEKDIADDQTKRSTELRSQDNELAESSFHPMTLVEERQFRALAKLNELLRI